MTPAELVKASHAEPPLYLLVVSEPLRLSVAEIARRLREPYPVHGLTLSSEPVVRVLRYVPQATDDEPLREELRVELARVAAEHPAHRVRIVPARAVIA